MLVLKSRTQINGLSPCKCKGDAVRLSQRSGSSTFPSPPECSRSLSLLILFKHKVHLCGEEEMALKLKSPQGKPAVRGGKNAQMGEGQAAEESEPEEAVQGLHYGFGIV